MVFTLMLDAVEEDQEALYSGREELCCRSSGRLYGAATGSNQRFRICFIRNVYSVADPEWFIPDPDPAIPFPF